MKKQKAVDNKYYLSFMVDSETHHYYSDDEDGCFDSDIDNAIPFDTFNEAKEKIRDYLDDKLKLMGCWYISEINASGDGINTTSIDVRELDNNNNNNNKRSSKMSKKPIHCLDRKVDNKKVGEAYKEYKDKEARKPYLIIKISIGGDTYYFSGGIYRAETDKITQDRDKATKIYGINNSFIKLVNDFRDKVAGLDKGKCQVYICNLMEYHCILDRIDISYMIPSGHIIKCDILM